MIGIYLSGTGNTRHCIEKLTGLLDSSAESMPLESRGPLRQYEIMIRLYWDILRSFQTHLIWSGILYTEMPVCGRKKAVMCFNNGCVQR